MKIAKDHIVGFNYVLKDDDGMIIDQSKDGPHHYTHGHGKLVKGLEKALEGKSAGWQGSVRVSKEEGYGTYEPKMVLQVPIEKFGGQIPSVGALIGLPNYGEDYRARVIRSNDQEVTLDANHPLAGLELTWDVEIVSVRPAATDELPGKVSSRE